MLELVLVLTVHALKQGYTPDNCKSSHFQRVPIGLPIHTMPIFRDCDVTCKHSILSRCHFLIVVRPFPSGSMYKLPPPPPPPPLQMLSLMVVVVGGGGGLLRFRSSGTCSQINILNAIILPFVSLACYASECPMSPSNPG